MADMNAITITGTIQEDFSLTGKLSVGLKVLSPYEDAVRNGYEGTREQWLHENASSWCNHTNMWIDQETGCLMGEYDIDRYDFSVNATGNMIVTLKNGGEQV